MNSWVDIPSEYDNLGFEVTERGFELVIIGDEYDYTTILTPQQARAFAECLTAYADTPMGAL